MQGVVDNHTFPLETRIRSHARALGFDVVGIAPVDVQPEADRFVEWLQAGYAGEMEYLHRQMPARMEPRQILPDAASVIVAGVSYNTAAPTSDQVKDPRRGWISRYAWGADYHEVMQQQLEKLDSFIKELAGEHYQSRFYVDTGPVLDRVFARHAGLGWFGKNTNLLNQKFGSWIFIGEIITNLTLQVDQPVPDRCGRCHACMDACPTGAFVAPYVLDARRCISYLTIELRGAIPADLRERIGQHVFGCDICQEVCPWNRKAAVTSEPAFAPRPGNLAPDLVELAQLDDAEFRQRFQHSAVRRAKRHGILRNILVAMGNSRNTGFLPFLRDFLEGVTGDPLSQDDMLREHGRWTDEQLRKLAPKKSDAAVPESAEEV